MRDKGHTLHIMPIAAGEATLIFVRNVNGALRHVTTPGLPAEASAEQLAALGRQIADIVSREDGGGQRSSAPDRQGPGGT